MANFEPGPAKHSSEGLPMFVRVEDDGTRRWVVLKDGAYYYCDGNGRALPASNSGSEEFGGVVLGGLLGLAFGPAGVIVGAVLGGLTANATKPRAKADA